MARSFVYPATKKTLFDVNEEISKAHMKNGIVLATLMMTVCRFAPQR
jgi:hypothetical protein